MKQPRTLGAPFIHGFIVDEWETTNLLRANSERLAAPQVPFGRTAGACRLFPSSMHNRNSSTPRKQANYPERPITPLIGRFCG